MPKFSKFGIFKYLSVLNADGKCDNEIWMYIRLANDAFQKITKVIRYKEILLQTKANNKRVKCCQSADWLHWRLFTEMKKKEPKKMRVYKKIAEKTMDGARKQLYYLKIETKEKKNLEDLHF